MRKKKFSCLITLKLLFDYKIILIILFICYKNSFDILLLCVHSVFRKKKFVTCKKFFISKQEVHSF